MVWKDEFFFSRQVGTLRACSETPVATFGAMSAEWDGSPLVSESYELAVFFMTELGLQIQVGSKFCAPQEQPRCQLNSHKGKKMI